MHQLPLSTRAQRSVALAHDAAARLESEYVGTEHLLLGLLDEQMGPAAQILRHLGVTAERVEEIVRQSHLPRPS